MNRRTESPARGFGNGPLHYGLKVLPGNNSFLYCGLFSDSILEGVPSQSKSREHDYAEYTEHDSGAKARSCVGHLNLVFAILQGNADQTILKENGDHCIPVQFYFPPVIIWNGCEQNFAVPALSIDRYFPIAQGERVGRALPELVCEFPEGIQVKAVKLHIRNPVKGFGFVIDSHSLIVCIGRNVEGLNRLPSGIRNIEAVVQPEIGIGILAVCDISVYGVISFGDIDRVQDFTVGFFPVFGASLAVIPGISVITTLSRKSMPSLS